MKEPEIYCYLAEMLLQKHKIVAPNVKLWYPYESDVVSITKKNKKGHFLCEHEIKTSIGDFRADFLKGNRDKHRRLAAGKSPYNYFNFVVTENIVDIVLEELPEYSGLYLVDMYGSVQLVKRPRRLHDRPTPEKFVNQIARSLSYRALQGKRDAL